MTIFKNTIFAGIYHKKTASTIKEFFQKVNGKRMHVFASERATDNKFKIF